MLQVAPRGDLMALRRLLRAAAALQGGAWAVRPDFDCLDCGNSTVTEYYIVHDEIWPLTDGAGLLCIGCLETRLRRRLTAADFTDAPVNALDRFKKSDRLRNRMTASAGSPRRLR